MEDEFEEESEILGHGVVLQELANIWKSFHAASTVDRDVNVYLA